MKVLFFAPNVIGKTEIKGTGNWVSCLLEAIRKFDPTLDVTVAFHDNKADDVELIIEDQVKLVKIPHKGRSKLTKIKNNWIFKDIYRNALPQYLRVIDKIQPDIIQLFGLEHPYIRVVGNTTIPIIVHLQGMNGPIYIKSKSNKRFSTIQILKSTSIKNLITGNIPYIYERKKSKVIAIEETYYSKIDFFLGRTDWDYLFTKSISPFSEYFLGQELLRSSFYENEWKPRKTKCFVIFSTLGDGLRYNIDIIFRSIQLLERTYKEFGFIWNIAGLDYSSTTYRVALKSGIYSKKVNFLGRLDSKELVSEMLNSNLFVFPTAIDNSPNALQEALLLGMPVIATHAGGVSSLIEHRKTGYLIPEGEPYSLAGAIVDIYQNYDKAILMANNARKVAQKRNDPECVVNSLKHCYQQILIKKDRH